MCMPEINTSEIIADFQWRFPMDFPRRSPQDVHLSVVQCPRRMSLVSAGCPLVHVLRRMSRGYIFIYMLSAGCPLVHVLRRTVSCPVDCHWKLPMDFHSSNNNNTNNNISNTTNSNSNHNNTSSNNNSTSGMFQWNPLLRFPVQYFVLRLLSISEISSCFLWPRPWHIEIRHRVKKTSTINLLGFETLKLKIRRLKFLKPTVFDII